MFGLSGAAADAGDVEPARANRANKALVIRQPIFVG